jgi:hypothetical protein
MNRRIIFGMIAVAAAIAVWVLAGTPGGHSVNVTGPRGRSAGVEASDLASPAASRRPLLPTRRVAARPGTVQISGTVIDRADGSPVGGVEVVVRGPLGEASVAASADGAFSIDVAPGTYRVFARGDDAMTVGLDDPARIDTGPRVELAGMPDESLMPLVRASRDVTVELPVVHGGAITGKVVDDSGAPIAHAVVRARGGDLRPALGTDIAETDEHGAFELHVPAGHYTLDAAHDAFAGARETVAVPLAAGQKVATTIHLGKGCVIRGKVVTADGSPANEGALELRNPRGQFGSSGWINSDGTFRWSRLAAGEVTLRAWPWKSAPSAPQTFACAAGTHVDNVVFKLPGDAPALQGTIVDASGAPVPFAFIDVQPLDNPTFAQQERADAAGRWHVYDAPPGRYELTATAAGDGIASQVVVAPHAEVRVQLGGTGRIEGTTTDLATGSFEVAFDACTLGPDRNVPVAHEPRLVEVHGGRFTIDGVPACALMMTLHWRDTTEHKALAVDIDRPTHLQLDLGTPRGKTVHGIVRDGDGRPVPGASVTSTSPAAHATAGVRTDEAGRFTIGTFSGAQLSAGDGERVATADIGHTNVSDEQLDLVVR